MSSLTRHLTAGREHDALRYHPDCARCVARFGPPPQLALAGRTGASVLLASTALAATPATAAAQGVQVDPPKIEQESPDPADGPEERDDPDVDHSEEPAVPDGTAPAPAPEQPPPAPAPEQPPPAPAPEQSPPAPAPEQPPPAPEQPPPAPAPEQPPPAPAAPAPSPAPPTPTPSATPPMSERPAPADRTRSRDRARQDAPAQPAPTAAPDAPPAAPVEAVPDPPAPQVVQVEQAPVAPAAASGSSVQRARKGLRTHRVAEGESLWGIARARLGAGASPGAIARYVDRLWSYNSQHIGSADPDVILVGVTLLLPPVDK